MRSATLRVGGMSCAACSSRIERAVLALEGVSSAEASFVAGTLKVSFDEDAASLKDVESTVRSAGYSVMSSDRAEAKRERDRALRIQGIDLAVAAAFSIPLMALAMGPMAGLDIVPDKGLNCILQLALCIPVLFSGRRFYLRGYPALLSRSPTMDSLVALSTTASFVLGLWNSMLILSGDPGAGVPSFDSAAMIITLVGVGKYVEARSRNGADDAVGSLLSLSADRAHVVRDGAETDIDASDLVPGDVVAVRPGDRVPADGTVAGGTGFVDESMITGESMPVTKKPGDRVYGASVNVSGSFDAVVDRSGEDAVLFQMAAMMETAKATKAPVAGTADRVAAVFVPAVMLVSLATFAAWFAAGRDLQFSLTAAISVLVISCPCALGLATPLAMVFGMRKGSEHGILFKDSAAIEAAGRADTVILDKTGTVTLGSPEVVHVEPVIGRDDLVRLAAAAESRSEHPLAKAIVRMASGMELPDAERFESFAGEGVSCIVEGREVSVGSPGFISGRCPDFSFEDCGMTSVHVSVDGRYAGRMDVADPVRHGCASAVRSLKAEGLDVTVVSGDCEGAVSSACREAGIGEFRSGMRPGDKLSTVKRLQVAQKRVAMAGDGINDAPALAQADAGMAMGSGTDIAMESGNIVLMNPDPRCIPAALEIGRAVLRDVRQNLAFAFCYNVVCIPIAAGLPIALGYGGLAMQMPMVSAAAMSMSSICVVANAARLGRFEPKALK